MEFPITIFQDLCPGCKSYLSGKDHTTCSIWSISDGGGGNQPWDFAQGPGNVSCHYSEKNTQPRSHNLHLLAKCGVGCFLMRADHVTGKAVGYVVRLS